MSASLDIQCAKQCKSVNPFSHKDLKLPKNHTKIYEQTQKNLFSCNEVLFDQIYLYWLYVIYIDSYEEEETIHAATKEIDTDTEMFLNEVK